MDVITRILELAKSKGISLTFICNKLGRANNYLLEIKKGKNRLTDDNVSIIADILDTTPEYLKGETDIKEKKPAVTVYDEHDNIIRLDNETLELIDSLRTRPEMKMMFSVSKNATKEDIIKAVKIIEALKDESEGNG